MTGSLYEMAGGEAGLRAVIADFYDRLFDDLMIGFFFKGQDKGRLIDREVELTARLLGGDVAYRGRPLRAAHARHPIMKGHFMRRHRILEETLADHDVPAPVRDAWLRHSLDLQAAILGEARHDPHCDHEAARRRVP